MSVAGDTVRVTVSLAVPPALAFDIFTQETDLWWNRGIAYRVGGRLSGVLHFEPIEGGRLFEEFTGESGPQLVEFGRITAWEPPYRLAFEWRNVNFVADERTEVEVLFDATDCGTRVTLTHRGWASLRADHPARHGHDVTAFIRMMGLWWGKLLSSLREHSAHRERRLHR